ncbi:hypothetical protein J1605_001995 [Eschrichtius robustus]|uniref:Uncharacterized protein n=1 Tax=Eschrichtius robustus TaxID=9764 RepID=A0AB34I2U7_ESCRO|nr:hypothetical protein J1605_010462 [Eschrichtius robustus]KAJ8796924.1 hypothetical protein J1605_001995 [Eschrichtius robustus]
MNAAHSRWQVSPAPLFQPALTSRLPLPLTSALSLFSPAACGLSSQSQSQSLHSGLQGPIWDPLSCPSSTVASPGPPDVQLKVLMRMAFEEVFTAHPSSWAWGPDHCSLGPLATPTDIWCRPCSQEGQPFLACCFSPVGYELLEQRPHALASAGPGLRQSAVVLDNQRLFAERRNAAVQFLGIWASLKCLEKIVKLQITIQRIILGLMPATGQWEQDRFPSVISHSPAVNLRVGPLSSSGVKAPHTTPDSSAITPFLIRVPLSHVGLSSYSGSYVIIGKQVCQACSCGVTYTSERHSNENKGITSKDCLYQEKEKKWMQVESVSCYRSSPGPSTARARYLDCQLPNEKLDRNGSKVFLSSSTVSGYVAVISPFVDTLPVAPAPLAVAPSRS